VREGVLAAAAAIGEQSFDRKIFSENIFQSSSTCAEEIEIKCHLVKINKCDIY